MSYKKQNINKLSARRKSDKLCDDIFHIHILCLMKSVLQNSKYKNPVGGKLPMG